MSLFAFCGPGVAELHGVDFLFDSQTSSIVDLM
jgi:hypothetical protein